MATYPRLPLTGEVLDSHTKRTSDGIVNTILLHEGFQDVRCVKDLSLLPDAAARFYRCQVLALPMQFQLVVNVIPFA